MFKCKITLSVSETKKHFYRGKGVCERSNGLNSENTIFFRKFFVILPGIFGDYCTLLATFFIVFKENIF